MDLFEPPTDQEIEQRREARKKNCNHQAYSYITAQYLDMTFKLKVNPVLKTFVTCGICYKSEEITDRYEHSRIVNPASYFSKGQHGRN